MKIKYFFLFTCLMIILPIAHADNVRTSKGLEVQVTGPEQWTIGATKQHIDGTMLVAGKPYPDFFYAIRVFVKHDPGQQDRALAKSIAKYALGHGYLEHARTMQVNGQPIQLIPEIGVAVIQKEKMTIFSSYHGYRFLFKLNELK